MARARILILALLVLAALVLLGSACVPVYKSSAAAGIYPITKEYQIEARQFDFTPNEIRVAAGTRVRLVVRSADVDHRIAVAGLTAEKETVQGRRQTLELVAWPTGTYEMVCAVVCGTSHDRMRGTLIVE